MTVLVIVSAQGAKKPDNNSKGTTRAPPKKDGKVANSGKPSENATGRPTVKPTKDGRRSTVSGKPASRTGSRPTPARAHLFYKK